MALNELLAELFGAGVGALLGVILGLEFDKWREHSKYENRIKLIAPKVVEEFKENIRIYNVFIKERDEFWRIRYRLKSIRHEAYKNDLWKWSIENNGDMPVIYETIHDINFYLDRYGNNPQFTTIIDKLMTKMNKFMSKQPKPFTFDE